VSESLSYLFAGIELRIKQKRSGNKFILLSRDEWHLYSLIGSILSLMQSFDTASADAACQLELD
jgi:hypothetical protein